MATPSSMQAMAAEIFSDMVMEEAIKDKTIQVQQKMKDEEGKYLDPATGLVDDQLGGANAFHQAAGVQSDDELDGLDDDEEKIMREFRE